MRLRKRRVQCIGLLELRGLFDGNSGAQRVACVGSGNGERKGHSERLVEQLLNLGTLTKHTKRIDGWVAALVLDLIRDMLLKQQPSC
jgi:hypothetical protein